MQELTNGQPSGSIRRVAVLTAGPDGPGMNAAIRATVRQALALNWTVVGIRQGFSGLVRGAFEPLDSRAVSHRIDRGGTFLGTSMDEPFPAGADLRQALRQLNSASVDALVTIGGPSCARGTLAIAEAGFPAVMLPATIENDLWGTDRAIGVDTALNNAMDAIDRIKDTASSMQQAFVVELAGAQSGYLSLLGGIVGGAELSSLPELDQSLEEIAQRVADAYVRGKRHCIIAAATGGHPSAAEIASYLSERQQETGFPARLITLGDIQRGGSPTARDRMLATLLGAAAVQALAAGERGALIGLQQQATVPVPLQEVVARTKPLDAEYRALATILAL
ncbi:MAG: ATP-dependent 6-phosphofructokinase [Anaerolineae bacterium]|jgi:6-phosphofructokinase 1|nr:ATP-dependent 6-phosphofructokinase [Chloroflexota bacterium]